MFRLNKSGARCLIFGIGKKNINCLEKIREKWNIIINLGRRLKGIKLATNKSC
jgi:hypothetical protein